MRDHEHILSRTDTDQMEARVMASRCSDTDYRALMDSHEALRNLVAYYTQRTQHHANQAKKAQHDASMTKADTP
jgi:hypothetical protein